LIFWIDLVLLVMTLLLVDWIGIFFVVKIGTVFEAFTEVIVSVVLTISFVGIGLILNVLLVFCAIKFLIYIYNYI